jgi:hypothetical protein
MVVKNLSFWNGTHRGAIPFLDCDFFQQLPAISNPLYGYGKLNFPAANVSLISSKMYTTGH